MIDMVPKAIMLNLVQYVFFLGDWRFCYLRI